MKRLFLSLSIALLAQQSLACIGESKIVAQVSGVQLTGSTGCVVTVDPNSVQEYVKNPACPLDVHAIFQNGIEVGVRREDICRFDIGETVRGALYQDVHGTIHLE